MIDILGYSVMSNHYHAIMRNRPDLTRDLSPFEIAVRIWRLRHEADASYTPKRRNVSRRSQKVKLRKIRAMCENKKLIENYRQRFSSISWLMFYLNHSISARINEADGTNGRVWSGPFYSEHLDTIDKLLSAMVYVDLNPIRAGMAETPEQSLYTSVYDRIKADRARRKLADKRHKGSDKQRKRLRRDLEEQRVQREVDAWLSPIDERDEVDRKAPPTAGSSKRNKVAADRQVGLDEALEAPVPFRASDKGCLPISTTDYFALVDYMGRRDKRGKRGKIPSELPSILKRLGIPSPEKWLLLFDEFQSDLNRRFSRGTNRPQDLERIKQSKDSDKPLDVRSFL